MLFEKGAIANLASRDSANLQMAGTLTYP
jgi:hypothetical protein